ncbi:acyl carrier protein [Paenibacillus sp. sgz500958]|uniref:acyl carrier protein n=1 Tax=Paenibacillus sp. sgz500958 TaxID=3242475 RepID=UPI0036D3297B
MVNDVKERVMAMLRDNLGEESGGLDQIGPDDNLAELGVNSITFIRLVLAAELEFGLSWDDEELDYANFSTINNIIEYISSFETVV